MYRKFHPAAVVESHYFYGHRLDKPNKMMGW